MLAGCVGFPSIGRMPSPHVISLAGAWRLRLDPDNVGRRDRWFAASLGHDTMQLPGTTDLAGYGDPYRPNPADKNDPAHRGRLVRAYRYIGPAWYQRDLVVPGRWAGKHLRLMLERCMWTSEVWLGDTWMGRADSLVSPHVYNLGTLRPGVHRLTLRIDNSMDVNIGTLDHAYGDETQSRWNGVVGRIEVEAHDPVFIQSLSVYPDADRTSVRLKAHLHNMTDHLQARRLVVEIRPRNERRIVGALTSELSLDPGVHELSLDVPITGTVVPWDEFSPALYVVRARLHAIGSDTDGVESEALFGFRSITRRKRAILVNGRRIFLRGTLDCCVYPRTGHPPMDVDAWRRVMTTIKAHGLNHVRFHSWCPPEAAFQAADELGLYLQPETPLWIDAWMTSTTPTHPKLFGRDPQVVDFIRSEMRRILNTYGNHPSFALFCVGNEIAGESDYELLNAMIARAKRDDPRHLYTTSTARRLNPADDYYVSHATPGGPARGVGPAHTDWDFRAAVRGVSVPLIAHETGQRPVYPFYARELPKYTGPLKPFNLACLRDALVDAGLQDQNEAFHKASGRFMLVQYKAEHEAFLRTPDYAGFQLLMLNDFTGQGEAHVGVLDPFWESKGFSTAAEMRRWCSPTVPLLRVPKFIWTKNETFVAQAQIAHYGAGDLVQQEARWRCRGRDGHLIASGVLKPRVIPTGAITPLGEIRIDLNDINTPMMLRLEISLPGVPASNAWNFWVYPPPGAPISAGNVLITDCYDDMARAELARGGRVLLLAHGLENDVTLRNQFLSAYWSSKWFPDTPGTLGLLCDPRHPALALFPTASYSDWQWRDLAEGSTTFRLDTVLTSASVIVQCIPDFHRPRLLADVFEARVGPGRLLVCGYDLSKDIETRPAAAQLMRSLLAYMNTARFKPTGQLDPAAAQRLLKPRRVACAISSNGRAFEHHD